MSQAERGLFEQLNGLLPTRNIAKLDWAEAERICKSFEQRLAAAERDARRYQWLRSQPNEEMDYTKSNNPWCVHLERQYGAPTIVACNYATLDAAIDAALTAPLPESNQNE